MADFFIKLINYIIAGVGAGLTWILALLPMSPFSEPLAPPGLINLGWITWLLDFPTWIKITGGVLIAIAIWYGIRIAARWLKLASG